MAERLGIEPSSARSRPDNGFEDRGGHQAPSTLRIVCRAGAAGKTIGGVLQTPESLQYGVGLREFTRRPLGMHQLVSDPQMYAKWSRTDRPSFENLELVCSKHVDDLKGASTDVTFVDQLCKELTNQFGELTAQKRKFEHLGIQHVQNDDYSVECSQDHYVKQLRLMSLDSVSYTHLTLPTKA